MLIEVTNANILRVKILFLKGDEVASCPPHGFSPDEGGAEG
jgi:hypothetical protein